jgi:hypothetical protein
MENHRSACKEAGRQRRGCLNPLSVDSPVCSWRAQAKRGGASEDPASAVEDCRLIKLLLLCSFWLGPSPASWTRSVVRMVCNRVVPLQYCPVDVIGNPWCCDSHSLFSVICGDVETWTPCLPGRLAHVGRPSNWPHKESSQLYWCPSFLGVVKPPWIDNLNLRKV